MTTVWHVTGAPCGEAPFMVPMVRPPRSSSGGKQFALETLLRPNPCRRVLFAGGGWRVAASAIDAMQQIPAREMPVQARDPSSELGVLIKRPFGVRVTNGCEIV